MTFERNQKVIHEVPDIEGVIKDARLDEKLEIQYLVAYKDAQGQEQQRYFKASELKAVKEKA